MNIVIPMSGMGTRFSAAGYAKPKPFIDVGGKPMILRVTENVRPKTPHEIYWIVRQEHLDEATVLAKNVDAKTIVIPGVTQGAACTVLFAHDYINNDQPLMLANSDQLVDCGTDGFISASQPLDGGIMVFKATESKWSYARTGHDNIVREVAEKIPISGLATVGIYYFSRGANFVSAAKDMIRKDIRINGEFYVAPVYNELVLRGLRVIAYEIGAHEMHGLGTPEDLGIYLRDRRKTQ